jgi:hypothetical protein
VATSPSHKFGQIIGDLLEEIVEPQIREFCDRRGLYLDKKELRGPVREGKKVTWQDKFGNSHDLDFVIEKGGSKQARGRPIAFIEAAWRRYTKHSRNKAQEIQGALLPIAEKYEWDQPFLGAILAGVFTNGSLAQMKSSGFEVLLFPYETITKAFRSIGIDVEFDEETPDVVFEKTIRKIESLTEQSRRQLKKRLIDSNKTLLKAFFDQLEATLDRRIEQIVLIPLHGRQNEFAAVNDAVAFIEKYDEASALNGGFKKYEVIVRYSNGDKIDASFAGKQETVSFLKYISGA